MEKPSKQQRLLLNYFITGVGVGNLISLLNLWAFGVTEISLWTWLTISLLSGVIGLISLIFESENLPFKLALPLHFVLVLGVIALMNWLNGWGASVLSLPFILLFILIYLTVWLLVLYMNRQEVSKINEQIKERKKARK